MKKRYLHKFTAALLTTFGLVCLLMNANAATTFVVTTTNDSGAGSLRQAISSANAIGNATILFSNVTGTIFLTNGGLVITNTVQVIGPGPTNLTVNGRDNFTVFIIPSNGISTVLISGLAIKNGREAIGGGISNAATLLLTNCLIASNTAISATVGFPPQYLIGGGGILNRGVLDLKRCSIVGNTTVPVTTFRVAGPGAGVCNVGAFTAMDCIFAANAILGPYQFSFAGQEGSSGGAVFNAGTLSLTRCSITGNTSGSGEDSDGVGGAGGSGGGIFNASSASIVLKDCTIDNNRCGKGGHGAGASVFPAANGGRGGDGGGICNLALLYATNCTLYGNSAGLGGDGGNTSLSSHPVAGNGGAGGDGAGFFNAGTVALVSCTVAGNATRNGGSGGFASGGATTPGSVGASGRGGGVWNQSGTIQVRNTIIGNNTATGGAPDVGGSFSSQGHNLVQNTNGSQGFVAIGDWVNTNPQLASLANNGGPTLTCALPVGSPAINVGDDLITGADQRGFARHYGTHVDIGAFELQPFPSSVPRLTSIAGNGVIQLAFTNTTGVSFVMIATTNVATPSSNWTVLGVAVENPAGQYRFNDLQSSNPRRFYRARWT